MPQALQESGTIRIPSRPDTSASLSHQDRLIAFMAANDVPSKQIAAYCDISPRKVLKTLRRPEVSLFIDHEREQRFKEKRKTVDEWIKEERHNTMTRLRDLRDQDDERGVALSATREFLDRDAPKKQVHESDRDVRLWFPVGTLETLAMVGSAVLQKHGETIESFESKVFDVTPTNGTPALPPALDSVPIPTPQRAPAKTGRWWTGDDEYNC